MIESEDIGVIHERAVTSADAADLDDTILE